ncbi:type IV pilin protein [Photobacterium leiognathi]|uniref:type IV pilin protein n=1 Tax=Photobacterium leiognathi TaxID=553611 RepID=UPI002981B9B7|nr:pilin [Photobacterium leiognathi]
MKKQQGFTLIELMIVVAVIGLLSAIAIPKYQEFAKKGAIASGVSSLSGLKTNIEEYIVSNGSFPSSLTDAGAVSSGIGSFDFIGTSGAKFTFSSGAASGAIVAMHMTNSGWTCKYGTGPLTKDYNVAGCIYAAAPGTP